VATGGTSPHAVASMHAGSKLPRHEEDAFARLADDEPSSAGFYADQQGRVVVTVSDSTAVGRAISAMARRQSATDVPLHPALRSASIIVKRGSYSFQQLSDWRDSVYLRMLGPVNGVIYDDLDEVANRVTIGVASAVPSARGEATAMLTKLGIPLAAVNFVTAEPLRPTAAASARAATRARRTVGQPLNGLTDTLAGGYAVLAQLPNNAVNQCTASLVAIYNGASVLMTVSHCTNTLFTVEGTTFVDGWPAPLGVSYGSTVIATETTDPSATGTKCGFYQGIWDYQCADARGSDVAFATLSGAMLSRRGLIARTSQRVTSGSGPLDIDSSHPWFYVTATAAAYVNEPVEKIGALTGWTGGSVTATCADALMNAANGQPDHGQFCSNVANYNEDEGDSGSPVFARVGTDANNDQTVVFLGVHFGKAGSTTGWFSSYSGILNDLNSSGSNLNVISDAYVGAPALSGSISGPKKPVLSWPAADNVGLTGSVSYRVYRYTWDATSQSSTGPTWVATTSSTTWTDATLSFRTDAYNGTTSPGQQTSYTSYYVQSYNQGLGGQSSTIFFSGLWLQ